jgi:hypothetical protein
MTAADTPIGSQLPTRPRDDASIVDWLLLDRTISDAKKRIGPGTPVRDV